MRRILLADDDSELLEVLGSHLEEWGYAVQAAHDGQELLTTLMGSSPPDLVIADIRMPGRSGLQVAQEAQRLQYRGLLRRFALQVPFVLITGYPSAEIRAEASRVGSYLLEKPLDPRHLHLCVQSLIG